MIELAIQHVLENATSLTALVDTRIDWGARTQGDDVPCCFFRLPAERDHAIRGTEIEADLEVIGFAETLQDAVAIAKAAWAAIDAEVQGGEVGTTGIEVLSLVRGDTTKNVELAVNGEDREPVEVAITGSIVYREV